jgi:hypothetical protein
MSVPVLCSDRVRDWVRQASKLEHRDDDDSPDEDAPHPHKGHKQQQQQSRLARGHAHMDGAGDVIAHLHVGGPRAKGVAAGKAASDEADSDGGPSMGSGPDVH